MKTHYRLLVLLMLFTGHSVCVYSQGYTLTLEEHAVDLIPGQTTYRLYMDMANPDDQLSHVYGQESTPLFISTTTGFYNDQFGGTVGSDINPVFLAFFPTLGADSWVTIGLDTASVGDEQAIGTFEDPNQPWVGSFEYGSDLDGQNVTIDSPHGGVWFVGSNAPNGAPDISSRVLIMQMTTAGEICGTLNLHVFQEGDESNAVNFTFDFCGPGTFDPSEVVPGAGYGGGCPDPSSCNYHPDATTNYWCLWAEEFYDCNGNCINDFDGDGICNELEVPGCTISIACNYNPGATDDDGSCYFYCPGCTDFAACNYDADAIQDDGSCTFCGCETATANFEGYNVIVEPHVVHTSGDLAGLTTYRLYFETPNPTDVVTSFTGNSEYALELATTTSFYQHPEGSWSAEVITGATVASYPNIIHDSYVTLNLEGPAQGTELNPTALPGSWTSDFAQGNNILIDDLSGSGWYVTPDGSNTAVDENNRVFFAQLTTDGTIYGQFRVQVYPEGDNINDERVDISFVQQLCSGCADAEACNFNDEANVDDGSCDFADPGYDCDGNCLLDSDGDGICDEFEVFGCTEEGACNYNVAATEEDGSCASWDECGICAGDGIAEGTCDCEGNLPEPGYNCDGVCLTDTDGDGVCDEFEIAGCTDATACNYDVANTEEDGSCDYCSCGDPVTNYTMTVEEYSVDGIEGMTTYRFYIDMENPTDFLSAMYGTSVDPMTLSTTDGFYNDQYGAITADGILTPFIAIFPTLEYDSWVTIGIDSAPQGSEVVISTIESGDQPWIQSFAYGSDIAGQDFTVNDLHGGAWFVTYGSANGLPDADNQRVLFMQLTASGSISGIMNAQIFPEGNNDNEIFKSFAFDGPGVYTAEGESEGGVGNACGCTDENADNYDMQAEYDDGACIYYGCIDATACNYDETANTDDGSCYYETESFNCYGECFYDDDSDGICDEFEVEGCTDNEACNYNENASDEDGSCYYPQDNCQTCSGETDGTGTVIDNDVDSDGVCDWEEIFGCNDEGACNFDNVATEDDGTCVYPVGCESCSGQEDGTGYVVDNDADGDGVCDMDEIGGCMDYHACNFNASATDEDGTCLDNDECGVCGGDGIADGACDCEGNVPDLGYDCTGVCIVDTDEDGICDEFEVAGCQDVAACNFNVYATDENGTCVFPDWCETCSGETDGTGFVVDNDSDDDGVCDWDEVAGCTASSACNYNENATDDDGSCYVPEGCETCSGETDGTGTVVDNDSDDDGVCDPDEIPGCQEPSACNFNSNATDNDGTCEWLSCSGCTYEFACNFNPEAIYSDGSCEFGTCPGCTDPTACNFNPTVSEDDGSCADLDECGNCDGNGPDVGYDCDGNCLLDSDGDGVCDPFEVPGCTNELGMNYDPAATDDDGSCEVPAFPFLHAELHAETDLGTTYRVYAYFEDANDECTALFAVGSEEFNPVELELEVTTSFYQNPLGANLGSGINPFFFSNVPTLEYDSWLTIGSENTYDEPVNSIGMSDAFTEFNEGNGFVLNSPAGGSWYMAAPGTNPLAVAGEDGRVLLAQLTVTDDEAGEPGEISGLWNMQWRQGGSSSMENRELYFTTGTYMPPLDGCTDADAANYNASATDEDGSCLYSTVFNVDMSCVEFTFSTVHITGPFCGWCGSDGWNDLSDADADGNYTVTLDLPAGDVEYKYMVDNWAGQEDLIDDMQNGASCAPVTDFVTYANRLTTAGSTNDDTYGSCIPCSEQQFFETVTFEIDMNNSDYPNADYDNVVINGSWNGWGGWGVTLADDDADGIYTGSALFEENTSFEFVIAVTGPADGWSGWGQVINAPAECSTNPELPNGEGGGNYGVDVGEEAQTVAYCAGECIAVCIPIVPGCMDSSADNFDPQANTGDQEALCEYFGCMDDAADNFDPDANVDDGSCLYTGCMDSSADNFDPQANTGDQEALCEYFGCMDDAADNFDPDANVDDGSCLYTGCMDSSADNFDPQANTGDQEALCEYFGCMDDAADNFDPDANVDDGSCLYTGCMDSSADNFDPQANTGDQEALCEYFGCMDDAADNFDPDANVDDGSCLYTGCMDSSADNFDPQANTGDQEALCEYFGCMDDAADNFDPDANVDDGSCLYTGCMDSSADNFDPQANTGDQEALCEYLGCTNEDGINFDPDANVDDGSCLILGCYDENADNYYPESNMGDQEELCQYSGCTDSAACNFDINATNDDGSCDYCQCLNGTEWSHELQGCIITETALIEACGEGTYWNELTQTCLPEETCEQDLDGDGVIGVEDLLQLLSSFGFYCE